MTLDDGVVCGEGFELVLCRHKGVACGVGDVLGHQDVVPLGGVDARAHCRASQRQLLKVRQRVAQGLQPKLQLRHIPSKLLPQRQGRRVHQVGAADLDNVVEGPRLLRKGVAQPLHPWNGRVDNGRVGRDVHRRGERVVGALAFVHVVVGVHRTVALTKGASRQHMGPVGHHLIDVHVALRPGARLPHHQWKLIVQLAGQNLFACRHDEVLLGRIQGAELAVGQGRCALQVGKGPNNLHGHGARGTDFEVVAGALGLGAPILVSRDVNFAERVFFDAGGHGEVGFRDGTWERSMDGCRQGTWRQSSSLWSAPAPAPIKKALRKPSRSPFITASTLDVSWPVRTSLTILYGCMT